jgi:hypothetical protein
MNDFDSSAPGAGPGANGSDSPPPAAPSAASPSGAAPLPPTPKRSFGRRHWGKLTFLLLLAIPLLGLAVWTAVGLNWTYASGQRAGYLQKISRKGWICKTWEGTLYTDIAKGFRSDSFTFTVQDDSIAAVLEKLSGKRVAVHYDQHNLVPTSCFGDTEYFVSKVDVLPE